MGAPFAYKTANTGYVCAAGSSHGSFQALLVADDADHVLSDLHPVDDRLKPCLSKRDLARRHVLAHQAPEALDRFRADLGRARAGITDPAERSLRQIPFRPQSGEPLLQEVVRLVLTVFHEPVKPPQLLLRQREFAAQRSHAAIDLCRLLSLERPQRSQSRP
ncbi:hypothetical protein MKK64_12545 [Methylobacterium sp. E-025]|uniref:hypothetical protein n=1 Tax=Methylobacterium sp. E-025 TaxID=2836561 RepID=UPI001FBBC073|nr:hypothetical protein [Methylobacterium sp. E-025]MCJ2112017.1 hypothetical protein [Methylobacterium sp. E-025]